MYRYWDGQTWSTVLSPSPMPGPPPDAAPPMAYGAQPLGWPPEVGSAYAQYQAMEQTKAKKPVAIWIAIVVAVLVLSLVAYFIFTRVVGGGPIGESTTPITPTQTVPIDESTSPICPQSTATVRADHPNDGRVYGGKLSFPMLPSPPWSQIRENYWNVPFGRDVADQKITIHADYQPGREWVISVLVGELYAGDGFYAPEPASEIVNRCIFGSFYGGAHVTAETLRSEAYSVDGYDGWITETNLSFSIRGLATTSELAIVIIVRTSGEASSIFYASIPNDAMQYMPDVEAAIADLHVVT